MQVVVERRERHAQAFKVSLDRPAAEYGIEVLGHSVAAINGQKFRI
jgi:hypothetical protein